MNLFYCRGKKNAPASRFYGAALPYPLPTAEGVRHQHKLSVSGKYMKREVSQGSENSVKL